MGDHPVFAAVYDRALAPLERGELGRQRAALLARASGRVLEIGAGTGVNLQHYRPDRVTSLDLLEPDAHMQRRMLRRLREAPVPVEMHALPLERAVDVFGTASFDTAVATLVLCSVNDARAAAEVIRQVLKPDGRLLFVEHVAAVGAAGVAHAAIRPVWRRLAGGCDLRRETTRVLREAGFVIASADRFHPVRGRSRNSMWVAGEAFVPERAR